jgi:hypothetical protein
LNVSSVVFVAKEGGESVTQSDQLLQDLLVLVLALGLGGGHDPATSFRNPTLPGHRIVVRVLKNIKQQEMLIKVILL